MTRLPGDMRRPCAGGRVAGDRGSGSVLVIAVMAAVLTTFTSLLVLGSVLVSVSRAAGVADTAAVAGMHGYLTGGSEARACRDADMAARRNAVALTDCRLISGGGADVGPRLRVRVAVPAPWGRQVEAVAVAGTTSQP